ncbi:hypothetical protein VNO80_28489 [Phaseolus coccineus]|uniref:Uncharacterized protein n=1 Tax=Phaseolus coccineus TaxID=3886 RepID=A0AAN9LAG9_PHACN
MGCSSFSFMLPLLLLTFSSIIIDSRVAEARLLPKNLFPPPSEDDLPVLPVPLPAIPDILPHPKVPYGLIPTLSFPHVTIPNVSLPQITVNDVKIIP